jgi:hypothetical protein
MMTDKVKAYRKQHRKCDYCIHKESSNVGGYRTDTAYWCAAKLKFISLYTTGLPRPFCRCFEVEKRDALVSSKS